MDEYDGVGNRIVSYLSSFYTYDWQLLKNDENWQYAYDQDGNLIEKSCNGIALLCKVGGRYVYVYSQENVLLRLFT